MRGSIVQQSPDSYTLIVSYKDEYGKRKQKWVTVHCNHKQAEKKLAELILEVENGTLITTGKISTADFLRQWLKDYVKTNLAERTYELNQYMINKHIIPEIGRYNLTDLKAMRIQKLYTDKIEGGLSNRSVQILHYILSKAFRYAMRPAIGLLKQNPLDGVDIPKITKTHDYALIDTPETVNHFLTLARETDYYMLFYLYLYTGMRRGEGLGLQWQDIDFLSLQISVNRQLKYRNSGDTKTRWSFGPPKGKKGKMIDISPQFALALQDHKKKQDDFYEYQQIKPEYKMVFCHLDGTFYVPSSITHAWIKLRNKAGLKTRLHDARHSMATMMLKDGIHPKIVQERLGHSRINTTLDTYSHVVPGLQKAAAMKLDENFNYVSNPLVIRENADVR